MFSGKRLGVCGILVAAAFLGGCANRGASMRIVNETSESILLEPMVRTAFLSRPLAQIGLGPGEEWTQAMDSEGGAWVRGRCVGPSVLTARTGPRGAWGPGTAGAPQGSGAAHGHQADS